MQKEYENVMKNGKQKKKGLALGLALVLAGRSLPARRYPEPRVAEEHG